MFETVVPEAVAPKSRKLFYNVLPLSLALHVAAVVAVQLGAVWNVVFPDQSPKLYSAYSLIADPPPPPPPPPPPVRRTVVATVQPVRMPNVAPTVIPDAIPVVTAEPEPDPAPEVDGGVEGGVEGGIIGGTVEAPPVEPPPPPPPPVKVERVQVERDAPLPVRAISQDFPEYPPFALRAGFEDTLVVRYVIGKDGRVKQVTVLRPPERREFADSAVSRIRQWRFEPLEDQDGDRQEVVHELTVEFRIAKRTR